MTASITYNGTPTIMRAITPAEQRLGIPAANRATLWERAGDQAAVSGQFYTMGVASAAARALIRAQRERDAHMGVRAESPNNRAMLFGLMNRAASGVIRAGKRVK